MQAVCEGYEVTTIEECASRCNIFVTTTGCKDIITDKVNKIHYDFILVIIVSLVHSLHTLLILFSDLHADEERRHRL